MEFYFESGNDILTVRVEQDGDGYRVVIGDNIYRAGDVDLSQGRLRFRLDKQIVEAEIAHNGASRHVAIGGQTWVFERLTQQEMGRSRSRTRIGSGAGALEATMPGVVTNVLVSPGDEVERGQTLALIEAMKMELKVSAPYAGRVQRVNCVIGETVERGKVLVELEAVEKHKEREA